MPVPEASWKSGEWVPLASTRCKAARYLADTRQLEIEFKAGKHTVYTYDNVSEAEAASFFSAPSHGKWIDQHIVKAGWKYSAKR
jgi:hypothetical protein